jgi:hypothetical protein
VGLEPVEPKFERVGLDGTFFLLLVESRFGGEGLIKDGVLGLFCVRLVGRLEAKLDGTFLLLLEFPPVNVDDRSALFPSLVDFNPFLVSMLFGYAFITVHDNSRWSWVLSF